MAAEAKTAAYILVDGDLCTRAGDGPILISV